MTLKLKSTKDFKSGHVNLLIYGEAGIGKTTLCTTAEDPLIISAEGGMLALSDVDLPVYEIKSREDLNEIYDFLTQSEGAKKYKTVCIDSLSEIAEVLLSDEKKLTKDARQAYGVMNDEMAVTIRGFRDLQKHVYFSAKLKKVVDEASGVTNYMPSVPGRTVLQDLPFYFDAVFAYRFGKLQDGSVYRYLQTSGDFQWVAKDRSGKMEKISEPNIAKAIATMLG